MAVVGAAALVFENQTISGDNSGTLPARYGEYYFVVQKDATVTVSAGGQLESKQMFLSGFHAAGVIVTGSNSKFTTDLLAVGNYGPGSLLIEAGGQVNVSNAYIGFNQENLEDPYGNTIMVFGGSPSTGSVAVSGNGSLFQTNSLYIGRYESPPGPSVGAPLPTTGILSVSNSGKVVANNGNGTIYVANASDSTGTVNIGAAAGQPAQAAGVLQAAEIAFGAGTGTMVFNHTEADYEFAPKVSGPGSLVLYSGETSLAGDYSSFTGSTTVNGGTLSVNTTSFGRDVTVNSRGFLGGTGSVGNVTLGFGGTLMPGNPTGTLSAGNVSFGVASNYFLKVNASGDSGKLVSSGTIFIDGSSVLSIVAADGTDDGSTYAPSTSYTIIEAATLTGRFLNVVEDFAFLDTSMAYTDKEATLTLNRAAKSDNSLLSFSDLASTPNRSSVADAVEAAGAGMLHDAVQSMLLGETEQGFQQLSGESHSTMQGALMTGADTSRSSLTRRILTSTGGVGASSGDQVSMGFHGEGEVPMLEQLNAQMWGEAFGGWGKVDATATTASVESYGGGFLTGFDAEIIADWRTGVMAGYSRNQFHSSGNGSSGSADSYHLGAYAGTQMGPIGLRLGASFTWHDLATSRDVAFTGFSDHLEADYNASTAQAFAEIGYAFQLASGAFEPFAGIAVINQHTDGFTESGGSAALSSSSNNDVMGVTTLGLRGEADIGQVNGFSASLIGSLAWRHAFGDVDPTSTMRFASGGNAFSVSGTPIDVDTALFEAGLSLEKDETLGLSLSYQGEIGATAQEHSGRFSVLYRF